MSRGRPRIEDQRPEVADIVGILPDRQAAKLLGVSRSTVAACRERLGLPAVEVDGLHLRIHELEQTIERLLGRLGEQE
jgi:excisionase family DNA binding protein